MEIKTVKLIVVHIVMVVLEVHCYEFSEFINSKYVKCQHNKNLHLKTNGIEVYVYDFNSENSCMNFPIKSAARYIITSEHRYILDRKLIVFVPDHRNHLKSTKYIHPEDFFIQTFRNIENTSLIIIDHSAYTFGKGEKIRNYEKAVMYTFYIGEAVGRFLADLHTRGVLSKNIHCIGHGLGAQMLGYVGPIYHDITADKISRITGIDPEGPCFSNAHVKDQLGRGFADFVDIYHCNAGALGTNSILGDANFFFNHDGRMQPRCSHESKSHRDKCSHMLCLDQWAATVTRNDLYLAWKCDNYDFFRRGMCRSNEVTIAGYANPGNIAGTFYAITENDGIAKNVFYRH